MKPAVALLRRRKGDSGYSSVELVLYMPLLMLTILVAVQVALIYLANEYASAAAREANRVARVTGDVSAGQAKGYEVSRDLGNGLLAQTDVDIRRVSGGEFMETTVTGKAAQIIPVLDIVEVSDTVRGPVERFDPDP